MRSDTGIPADWGLGAGPAWAVLREVVRRRMQEEDWRLACLSGFWWVPIVSRLSPLPPPYAGIVCKASSSLLFAERYADVQETWDSGHLRATLFSLLNSGASRPAEELPQRRLCPSEAPRSRIFIF